MSYTYPYPRPMVTVDIAVIRGDSPLEILLVRRKNDPFMGQMALPGGYLEMKETLEESARRELREETGIAAGKLIRFDTYDHPERDPRGRTITQVFILRWNTSMGIPDAGSDAAGLGWYPVGALPPMAFDHATIVRDVTAFLQEQAR